jgi:hypothetical protein
MSIVAMLTVRTVRELRGTVLLLLALAVLLWAYAASCVAFLCQAYLPGAVLGETERS